MRTVTPETDIDSLLHGIQCFRTALHLELCSQWGITQTPAVDVARGMLIVEAYEKAAGTKMIDVRRLVAEVKDGRAKGH